MNRLGSARPRPRPQNGRQLTSTRLRVFSRPQHTPQKPPVGRSVCRPAGGPSFAHCAGSNRKSRVPVDEGRHLATAPVSAERRTSDRANDRWRNKRRASATPRRADSGRSHRAGSMARSVADGVASTRAEQARVLDNQWNAPPAHKATRPPSSSWPI